MSRESFSVAFRLAAVAVSTFIRCQSRREIGLRENKHVPWTVSKSAEKQLAILEDMRMAKDFQEESELLQWLLDFLRSPENSLDDIEVLLGVVESRYYDASKHWICKAM